MSRNNINLLLSCFASAMLVWSVIGAYYLGVNLGQRSCVVVKQ